MTSITPSSGNVFSDLGLDPEARALEIVDRLVGIMDFPSRKAVLVRDIADAIRDGASEKEPGINFQAKFDGEIRIHVEAGNCVGDFTLSDEFMDGVRAHYTEDLIGALKVFADEPLSTEPGHSRTRLFSFEDLDEKIRRARAALAKVDGEK